MEINHEFSKDEMFERHLKSIQHPYPPREMQIEMTLRSHLTAVRIAEVKNNHIDIVLLTNAGVDEEIGKYSVFLGVQSLVAMK